MPVTWSRDKNWVELNSAAGGGSSLDFPQRFSLWSRALCREASSVAKVSGGLPRSDRGLWRRLFLKICSPEQRAAPALSGRKTPDSLLGWRIGHSRCAGPLGQQRCDEYQVAPLAVGTQPGRRVGSGGRVVLGKGRWLRLRVGRWSFQQRTSLLELVGGVGAGQAVGTDFDQSAW